MEYGRVKPLFTSDKVNKVYVRGPQATVLGATLVEARKEPLPSANVYKIPTILKHLGVANTFVPFSSALFTGLEGEGMIDVLRRLGEASSFAQGGVVSAADRNTSIIPEEARRIMNELVEEENT